MNPTKKICSITTIAPSMQSFMLPEAIALKEDGWDSIVITNITEPLAEEIPADIKSYSVPMERTYNIKVAFKCIRQLYRLFRKERPTVVQYGTTHACLFGSIAGFLARVPHRIFLQWGNIGYDDYAGLRRFFMMSVERLIARLSTDVRAQSPKNRQWSIDDRIYSAKNSLVVGLGGTVGVDLSQYDLSQKEVYRYAIRERYHISDDEMVFGFVGRLCVPKGVNELLEAFKKFSEGKRCKLMLIGPNESSGIALYEWASQSDKVVMTGGIPHDEMQKYFAAIDVLVHPTYREGFGMVLQEAMAMEVPIITTDIPGPSEVIEDGESGELVKVKDVESLANAMLSAYDNKEKWVQYGKNGRKRAEQHFERRHRLSLLVDDKNNILETE